MIGAKPIVAKRPKVAAMNRALVVGMQSVADNMLAYFKLTVTTWKHKVKFVRSVKTSTGRIVSEVMTEDEIYNYVSMGTRPHKIRAKNAPRLVFRGGGFVSKTIVGGLVPSKGQLASGDWVSKQEVDHPGTEARDFPGTISKRVAPFFRRRMELAMKEAGKASGHSPRG